MRLPSCARTPPDPGIASGTSPSGSPSSLAVANSCSVSRSGSCHSRCPDRAASYSQIAAAIGVSDSTAARRVESLIRRGCLRFRTIFETALIGLEVEFLQWFTVEPGELDNVGAQLVKERSTRYVSATTGRFNLCLHGVLPGYGDLYHYMTAVVGALPGVHTADMTLQARTLKRAWVPVGIDAANEERSR